MRNRILFDTLGIPYELRQTYKYNAEMQFKRLSEGAFLTVEMEYADGPSGKSGVPKYNNYYIDQHHKMFGIAIQSSVGV